MSWVSPNYRKTALGAAAGGHVRTLDEVGSRIQLPNGKPATVPLDVGGRMIGCLGEKVERLFGSCVGRWFGRWFGGGLEAGWEVVWRLGEASGEVPGEVSGEVPGEVSGRAPWVQFADRLGEQKCCVFTVYHGLGGVMREHAKVCNRRPPRP